MKFCVRMCILLLSAFAFTGCSQKYVSVQTIAPAQFEKALSYKHLSILPVANDPYQMAYVLEEKLLEKRFNDAYLFEIVSYDNSHTSKKNATKTVDAYISMQIEPPIVYDTPYYVERIECSDAKCKNAYTVYWPCIERDYTASIHFKIIDAKSSGLIYSKNLRRNTHHRGCHRQNYYTFPNTEWILRTFQEEMVHEFVSLISPTYYSIKARLAFDEPIITLSSDAKNALAEGIDALKEYHLTQAKEHFENVLTLTQYQSYVATHNLGLVYEAKGNFIRANTLFQHALLLVENPNEHIELPMSIKRIKQTLAKEQRATEQVLKTNTSLK